MESFFIPQLIYAITFPKNISYLILYHPNRAIIQNVWILFTKFTKKKIIIISMFVKYQYLKDQTKTIVNFKNKFMPYFRNEVLYKIFLY